MLSDEMTTGSVTSPDAHKRALAAKSHTFNLAHPRFKDAFPDVSDYHALLYVIRKLIDLFGFCSRRNPVLRGCHASLDLVLQYCTPVPRDLPNMGNKERGQRKSSDSGV